MRIRKNLCIHQPTPNTSKSKHGVNESYRSLRRIHVAWSCCKVRASSQVSDKNLTIPSIQRQHRDSYSHRSCQEDFPYSTSTCTSWSLRQWSLHHTSISTAVGGNYRAWTRIPPLPRPCCWAPLEDLEAGSYLPSIYSTRTLLYYLYLSISTALSSHEETNAQ